MEELSVMIIGDKKTVIILGAGASVDYGLPTSEKLIEIMLDITAGPYRQSYWIKDVLGIGKNIFDKNEIESIKSFRKSFREYSPVSIDKFLTLNSSNHELVQTGKMLITHVIARNQHTYNRGWYPYLLDAIVKSSDEGEILDVLDNLEIVTFNYDLTLEDFLWGSLKSLEETTSNNYEKALEKLFSKITHVYGSIFDYSKLVEEKNLDNTQRLWTYQGKDVEVPDSWWVQMLKDNEIRVIGEERTEDKKHLQSIKDKTHGAQRMYILGFGFDDTNLSLCGLDSLSRSKEYEINITNYGGTPRIQRKITETFETHGYKTIVSNKTVLEAVKNDFD